MAINKKLIHFNEKSEFDKRLANDEILDTSIVFVKDSKEIWTHGNLYKSVNWSVLKASVNLITFTIDDITYQAKEEMTWGEWVNSEYNINNFIEHSPYICFSNSDIYFVAVDMSSKNSRVTLEQKIISDYDYVKLMTSAGSN